MALPSIPADYAAYLQARGAFECFVNGDDGPGYAALWPLEQLQDNNAGYGLELYAPGFVAFGSNGGGELLCFDGMGAVYMLPAIGMEPDAAIRVADTFDEFTRSFESPS
jgi:hypothetical protein